MEKKKKVIIFTIVIAIVAIIVILLIINKQKKEESERYAVDMNEDISNIEIVEKEIYFKDYKIIKNCLQTYINTLNIENSSYYGRNENNEFVKLVKEEEIKENIYNLVSKNYITKNNITIDNIYDYVDTLKENEIIIPIKIDTEQENYNSNVKIYKVSALMIETYNKEKFNYIYFIINIDENNSTFSVEPVNNEDELDNIKIDYKIENIEKNDNNVFSSVKSTEEEIAADYFSNYKNILLSNINLAYSYLDNNYKEKRFGNIDEFNKYVKKNKEIFEKMRLEKYEVKYYDDYFQYICVDQFENFYVFNEKEICDFNVLLDVYTIDFPEVTKEYDSTNEEGKCILNIEKIKQALNSGDYKYVYSKLAENFKNNKYKTQQEFEDYIKQAIYNNINIEYGEFSNEGSTYIYDIKITDANNAENATINMQIIMQLKEDRDFVMSFSIK